VQAWLDTPTTNNEIILQGKTSMPKETAAFDSRENGVASQRPTLLVMFTPP
jgi:hypothetical protein